MLFAEADLPFLEVLWSMIIFFLFVAWIWVLISVFGDIFRRHDIGGWGKAGWTVFIIVLPFLGVLVYLIAQGREMGQRSAKQASDLQQQYEAHIREVAGGGGAASELAKAKELLDSGAINQAEYEQLKQKALS